MSMCYKESYAALVQPSRIGRTGFLSFCTNAADVCTTLALCYNVFLCIIWVVINREGLISLLVQRPARFSFLENSREFFFIFTSRSRSRAVSISLSLLEKEWRDFIFHFSLLEKSESYPYFTLFSREKRVKSGAGYNLTSIFVPNCISKNCQISSKHQPQNIGQFSISKSWPNLVLQVWTKHQLKKSDKN